MARVRLFASLLALLLVLTAVTAACEAKDGTSAGSPSSTSSTVLIFDISGSARTIGLENSFKDHLAQNLSTLGTGSTLTVLTLDGGGLTASCPPVYVPMELAGLNDDVRETERQKIINRALKQADALLVCAADPLHAVPGSDLFGATKKAERELDRAAGSLKVVLVSDGLQATNEVLFKPEELVDPKWREQALADLKGQNLLPDLTHVKFVITDLGAGARGWAASEAQALNIFWESYAAEAHTKLDLNDR
jgi:hypothetical protein